MQMELRCPSCPFRFVALADTPANEVLDRMIDDGPWVALGKGDTFEAMAFAALTSRGRICCPDCGRAVALEEQGRELFPIEEPAPC